MKLPTVMKQPSAVVPLVMSLGAFAVVTAHVALSGAAREPDEGTAARIFQLLMMAQVPVVAFFAIKWLPRAPRPAILTLTLQLGAAVVALAPVFFLGL